MCAVLRITRAFLDGVLRRSSSRIIAHRPATKGAAHDVPLTTAPCPFTQGPLRSTEGATHVRPFPTLANVGCAAPTCEADPTPPTTMQLPNAAGKESMSPPRSPSLPAAQITI